LARYGDPEAFGSDVGGEYLVELDNDRLRPGL
jgi:hypothetical protein